MATQHSHRVLIVAPIARVAAVVTWLRANIDTDHDAQLGPALNASGSPADPVTHRWMCGSFTDTECRQLLFRLCNLASITPPTNALWQGWTGPQKRSWLASVRNAIRTNYGVLVLLADNLAQWDSPQDALAALGLNAIARPPAL